MVSGWDLAFRVSQKRLIRLAITLLHDLKNKFLKNKITWCKGDNQSFREYLNEWQTIQLLWRLLLLST